jgi:hypothetical protein
MYRIAYIQNSSPNIVIFIKLEVSAKVKSQMSSSHVITQIQVSIELTS